MPRLISQLLSLLVVASVVMLVAGCGRKQPPATQPPPAPPPPVIAEKPPPPPPAPPPAPPTVPPAPATPTEEELFARMSLEEINAKRPLETVFFDYDRADLTERARTTLQKNAGWLSKFKTWNITAEGHADSRGTSEYNLALGERRAAAVRDYLVSLAVPTARINIVSKGKEQPTCTEETETCWAANRRGNFIVTAK